MIISRRRFEFELAKAREEVERKNLAENQHVQMMHRIDRQFEEFERCMGERVKSMDAVIADLQRVSEETRRAVDELEDKMNDRFIADARAMGELKMEIAAVRGEKK